MTDTPSIPVDLAPPIGAPASRPVRDPTCSFCGIGLGDGDAAWIARGPGVGICDRCVDLIAEQRGFRLVGLEAPRIDADRPPPEHPQPLAVVGSQGSGD